MNPLPAFTIETLAVPGRSEADGAQIAAVLQQELVRLWQDDRAAGLSWCRAIDAISLEIDDRLSAPEVGQKLARSIRERSLRGEGGS